MKMRMTLVATALVSLLAVSAAGAQPNSATTTLGDPTPSAGTTLMVTFEVSGTTPVVPYEYALQNTCALKGGHFTLGQHDDIVYWSDTDLDGKPDAVMPVYLQTVPVGASCRIYLVRNNTAVKGSTQSYTVGA
jgi:hypothetical protein